MPVLPEFIPGGHPGEAAESYIQGRNAVESWMGRAQARQIAAQQEEDQHQEMLNRQAEYVATLPVRQAARQTQIAQATAALSVAKRQQELQAQAAIAMPDAQNEFIEATQLADNASRQAELSRLQAKYSWMGGLKDYKPFTDALAQARGDAFHMAVADNAAEAALERTKLLAGTRENIAESTNQTRLGIAGTNAEARVGAAEVGANSRMQVAQTAASARVEAAKARANHAYETEVTIANRDGAIEAGDFEKAQIYQDRLNKLNSTPNNPLERPVPKTVMRPKAKDTSTSVTPITVPGAKAPQGEVAQPAKNSIRIPKGVPLPPAITISGKTYPVYKDRNGNAAYLKDGQYFEITEPTSEESGESQQDNERQE